MCPKDRSPRGSSCSSKRAMGSQGHWPSFSVGSWKASWVLSTFLWVCSGSALQGVGERWTGGVRGKMSLMLSISKLTKQKVQWTQISPWCLLNVMSAVFSFFFTFCSCPRDEPLSFPMAFQVPGTEVTALWGKSMHLSLTMAYKVHSEAGPKHAITDVVNYLLPSHKLVVMKKGKQKFMSQILDFWQN